MREQRVVRPGLPSPIECCVLLCRLYEDKGEADFMESLLQLFRSISAMMSSVSDQTVRVKVGPWVQQDRPSSRPTVSRRALQAGCEKQGLCFLQSPNSHDSPGVAFVASTVLLLVY